MRNKILAIALACLFMVTGILSVKASTLGWRLPFDRTVYISLGPGEGDHIRTAGNDSSEAIDYFTGSTFDVIAPADGTLINYITSGAGTFGHVLRIFHANSGSCSFYAHLAGATSVTNIKQGDYIADSGNAGLPPGSGIHLHFEARNDCLAGNVYSGSAASIKGIPGTWWRSSYEPTYAPAAHSPGAPPIPTSNPTPNGGGASYPPSQNQPALPLPSTVTTRLLANKQSPPNNPQGWVSNLIDGNPGNASIMFEGNPNVVANTPVSPYRTYFRLLKWATNCVPSPSVQCYDLVVDSYKVKRKEAISPSNESFTASHQHTYALYSNNSIYGFSDIAYIYEFYAGNSSASPAIPHLVITMNENSGPTVLEYCSPGADQYQVMEAHGGPATLLYQGPACSFVTTRTVGGTNRYAVQAHYASGWSASSPYVTLHY